MSRFEDPQSFFDAIYQGTAPWDIERAQPALAALFADYPPVGPVLDLGCGTGDLSLELGRRGLDVLGIDIATGAIESAQRRARKAAPEVTSRIEFMVADALRPTLLNRTFNSVVDSGFLHLFGVEERQGLVTELAAVIRPGGRFYLLAFAVEFDLPNTPMAVRDDELRSRFSSDQWQILEIRSDQFLSNVAPPVPAIAACFERRSAPSIEAAGNL